MDAQGVDRRRPRRARLDDGHLRRRSRARPGRGRERGDVRGPVPRDRRARDLRRRAPRASARALRPMTSGGHERRWAAAILAALALLALLPLAAPRDDVLNFVFLILLAITLAESWNIVAGYAGQVNLGHAAFFGLGALVTRTLWTDGIPVLLAMAAGAATAMLFALVIGGAAFRPRGAYLPIRTPAPGGVLRTTVGHLLPQISTLANGTIA